MSRTLVLSMKRPHEQFGLPMSFGRKLGASRNVAWVAVLVIASLLCVGFYIYQVNAAATKGFELRSLEKRLETVRETVASLEDQAATLQTMDALKARIGELGYVPADQLEFIDVSRSAYALAK